MPSFDVVNEVDVQEVDNAVNNVKKEVAGRWDFRNTTTEIELNRKDKKIAVEAGDEMKLAAIRELLQGHFVKRKIDPKCLEFKDFEPTSKMRVKQEIVVKEGIDKDTAKLIVKEIKDSKIKVQAAIQDNQVRVTGKSLDDLQAVIALLKGMPLEIPLQFVNMKR